MITVWELVAACSSVAVITGLLAFASGYTIGKEKQK